jgi:hypothetical protein
VVLLMAAVSLLFGPYERAGVRPMPDKRNLATLGERPNTNTNWITSGHADGTIRPAPAISRRCSVTETLATAAAAMEAMPAVLRRSELES